jgi:hypothetical protein
MRKKPNAGSELAKIRWSRKTLAERLAWGKWLTDKRIEKRLKEQKK